MNNLLYKSEIAACLTVSILIAENHLENNNIVQNTFFK